MQGLKRHGGNFKGDLYGAFSAAITTIPQSIGYGLVAFALLGPEFFGTAATLGLLSAVLGGATAALAGGASIQISGPKAPLTLIYGAVVASLMGHAQAFSVQSGLPVGSVVVALGSLSVLTAGLFQLASGALGLGGIVKYVPYTVVSGFMNGVALLIIFSQVRPLLGLPQDTDLAHIIDAPGMIQPPTVLVGLVTLVGVYAARRFLRIVPAALAALAAGTGLYYGLLLILPGAEMGPLLGSVAIDWSGLGGVVQVPRLVGGPGLELLLPALLLSGLVLGLVASMESLLSSVVCDNLTGERHNSNRELIGQGFANTLCSLAGVLPSGGSIPRSVQNFRAGGRTVLSGVLCSVMVLAIFWALGPLIGGLPVAVIAGVLLSVALDLFDDWTKNLIGKLRTHHGQRKEVLIDLGVAAMVALITVSVNIMVAIGAGVAIASVLFIARMGKSLVRRTYTGDTVHSRRMRSQHEAEILAGQGHSISVYELQGPIFFGSADGLATEIERSGDRVRYAILDLQRVTEIDTTGAKILARLARQMRDTGRFLAVSNVDRGQSLWGFLEVMDVVEEIGRRLFFRDNDHALEWAENRLLAAAKSERGDRISDSVADMDVAADMDKDELALFEEMLVRESHEKGHRVFSEGDPDSDLYIVLEGAVSIRKRGENGGQATRLVTFGRGSVFGEMALIDGNPRSADAWAEEDTELLRLTRGAFDALCREHPQVAIKLLENIARDMSFKLRRTSSTLATLERA